MSSFTRVSVDEMKFTPAHVEIVRGTSVRWEQSPKCMVRHCLEVVDPEENNQASSPALLPGEPWEHTFEACGDFHYRSLVYCFMKGTIKVVDAASAETRALGAKVAGASVETAAVAVDAADAPASAAKASASSPRDEAPAANSVGEREPLAARSDDADASAFSGRSIDPDPPLIGSKPDARPLPVAFEPPPSPTTAPDLTTANDSPSSANREMSEDFIHSCDRCARAFVSSTNLQRHRASHGSRGGRGKSKFGSNRHPKPPPASAEEVAAFFEGLPDDKKREALKSVAEPGSAGALVVCGVRARRDEGAEGSQNRSKTHAVNESRRAAYISAGAVIARWVEVFDKKKDGSNFTPTSASLFDALSGASEGTCFGPHSTVDLTTMCLDENLEAALAHCVEQRMFALYLEERSAEAEAARKALLLEIDESNAEEERRAARRAEARAKKKTAKNRSAKAQSLREKEAEKETETFSSSETATLRSATEAIASTLRECDLDDDRPTTGAVDDASETPTLSGAPDENRQTESTRDSTVTERSRFDAVTRRTETTGRRRGSDFRGDSAKGGGATPEPPSAPSAPRTRAVDEKRIPIANARPTTAPPSPLPPPNPPSAASTPRAVPAPRRTGIQSRTSPVTSAAAKGVVRDVIVKPLVKPLVSPRDGGSRDGVSMEVAAFGDAVLAPRLAGDNVTRRKSRRALKAERAEARLKGDAFMSSATDFESASGSDLGYKTASDTEFGEFRRGVWANSDAEPRIEDVRFATPAGTPAKLPVHGAKPLTPVAMLASPPSAASLAIPVAPVWSPEPQSARMATHPPAPPAIAPSMAAGAAGGMSHMLGHFPSMHPMYQPPPGVDLDVYMHHYATALAAIQASQAVAAGPGPFAPPLPPGPPPQSSRAREDR